MSFKLYKLQVPPQVCAVQDEPPSADFLTTPPTATNQPTLAVKKSTALIEFPSKLTSDHVEPSVVLYTLCPHPTAQPVVASNMSTPKNALLNDEQQFESTSVQLVPSVVFTVSA